MTATANFLIGLLVILLHEAAHIAAAWSLGLGVKRVGVSWKGMYIVRESGPPVANMVTTLAGPFLNLALVAAWPISHEFAIANLVFGIGNLLPMKSSDGLRALALARRQFRESAWKKPTGSQCAAEA
jgi:Zn-dependent protease